MCSEKIRTQNEACVCGKILYFFSVVCFLLAFVFSAGMAESKTVRIGWYQSDLFQVGSSDDEEKSGYCFQYIQKISDYNGWIYEYVYGEWPELIEKLKSGEIDIMAGVSETEERKAYMSFPNFEMGKENYCLYQHASRKIMDLSDKSTFSGLKVGGISNNRMTVFLEQWIADNGLDMQVVYYDTFEERDLDFAAGILDGIVATDNNILTDKDYSLVTSVGKEPYYLAVTKERPDLLHDLNDALSLMQEMEPYFLQNLQYSSYGTTVSNSTLTDAENRWVDAHGTMTIGYMDNYLPYCGTDENGNATGLLVDVVRASHAELKISGRLKVIYQPYDSYEGMIAALQDGSIDAAFPVGGGTWNLIRDGIRESSPVVTAGMDLVYKGNFEKNTSGVFAVNRTNQLQIRFIERNYPDAKLLECANIQECFAAVRDGRADYTIINGLRADLIRDHMEYESLSVMQLQKTDTRSFGVKNGNTALLLLINRSLRLIGEDYGSNAGYHYAEMGNGQTLADFVHAHTRLVLLSVLSVAALIVLMTLVHMQRIRRAQKETSVQLEKNRELTGELEKKNAELLEAKNAADASSRAKSAFLFNMSHDIRTPMNAIMGFTDLIEKHYDDKEKCMDYLHKARQANQFLLSLINDVLEMARIESGKENLNVTVSPVGGIAEESAEIFGEQMEKKGISFESHIETHTKWAFYDRTKVSKIYLNILSNAFKYTPAGGKISMQVNELPGEKPGYIKMKAVFSDTGIGMSGEFLPHLFEAFTREKTSTESRQQGTGLGMAIVKNILDFMGGTIDVESELGKGTTFTVTYPLKTEGAEPPESEVNQDAGDADFSGKSILLAEDNDLNAEIATEILTEAGFEVERAADGVICVEMLQRAEAKHYDLILMDIQMPNLNGYEAAKRIRALPDPKRASIPIVAMTANAFDEDKKNALSAGMNGHLAKPIDVSELMKTLAAVIGQKNSDGYGQNIAG